MSIAASIKTANGDIQRLAVCIEYLRSICDGAHARDFHGFSAFDKNLGHYLAKKVRANAGWTKEDIERAVDLAWKYRKQLGSASLTFPVRSDIQGVLDGMDDEEVFAVTPLASTAKVTLWIDTTGWLCLTFSQYDALKLGLFLGQVPLEDRRWGKDHKRWIMDPEHQAALEALYGVQAGPIPAGQPTVQPWEAPRKQPPVAPAKEYAAQPARSDIEISEHDNYRVAVRCPYAMKDRIKAAVPWKHREWDGQRKAWLVDRVFEDAVRRALGVA